MEDNEIIELFMQRNENAIKELADKYGHYCGAVALNILKNLNDSEECLNDAYLAVWNTVPPQKPKSLCAYTAKIVRNKALNLYNSLHTQKRRGGDTVPFDELGDLVSGIGTVESELNKKELLKALNSFLAVLPRRARHIFVGRYWAFCSIPEIADQLQLTDHNVTVILARTRQKLKKYLHERGFDL